MTNMADSLNQYLLDPNQSPGNEILHVPEGVYRGWVPRSLYSMELREIRLPFLRLLSFPVGGTSLGVLSKTLAFFDAVGNNLTRLPAAFAECSKLTRLNLSFNHLSEIPAPIYRLTLLEELNLEHNYITTLEPSIAQLSHLKVLNLNGSLLEEIPDELRRCKRLKELYLSGKIYPSGTLKEFPECVCGLPDLVVLDLSWQRIKKIPDCVGSLRKLEALSLKWNQLQEVSQDLRKCTKLKKVDLSGALRLLATIPEALFSLEDLEELYLNDNYFTDIPEGVCGLVKLTQLCMKRNSLLRISDKFYQLRYLERLNLSDNYLDSIAPGIKRLKRLQVLELDNNKLTELPEEVCLLEQLYYLGVATNQLTKLPESIYCLHNLRSLDVSNNQLSEVPLLMDQLDRLAENDGLHILNNNLHSPFKEITTLGTQALFEFLKGIRLKEAHHRWKMILIGAAQAGKTSLRQALMLGKSKLTAEHERTWVMERHLWEPESRLRVQVLDFGGHHIYQAAHHLFLSSDALHVLVFDLTKYTSQVYEDLIGHWLDAIIDRAAGAKIVLVGTHCDLCSEDDVKEKVDEILRLMHRAEQRKCQEIEREIKHILEEIDKPETKEYSSGIPEIGVGRLEEKLKELQKMRNSRSELPQNIFVVSCADDLRGVKDLRNYLIEVLKTKPASQLPGPWFTFLEQIQQAEEKVISWESALGIFQQVMSENQQSMMGMRGSPESSLDMVLKYFHSTGEIVWYHEDDLLKTTIFQKPESLIDMLRAVFRHDFEEVVFYNQDIGQELSFSESQFNKMKKNFLGRGLLTKEMLRYLLVHLNLSAETSDNFLKLVMSLLIKFSLCFELRNSTTNSLIGSSFIVQFPWFFPESKPEDFESKWPSILPRNTFELTMEIMFSGKAPPNFFEKLSVKLHSFLANGPRINWQDGVIAEVNSSSLLVVRERRLDSTVVVVSARGASDLQEIWSLVLSVRRAAMSLFKDWPLLKCEISLVCMHCVLLGLDDPCRYPGYVLEHSIPKGVYSMKCCDKCPDDSVPTCFVFPLLDIDDHCHQEYMKAATDFISAVSTDTLDGPQERESGILSDSGLAFLASHLGKNWSILMLRLGLLQSKVEQLQMNYPSDSYRQIFGALQSYREDGTTGPDKVTLLLDVLGSEDIGRQDLVDLLKEKYSLS
ncbi:malignant fibrous histiocytoma-amplified sequence 1 [Biomphalaria glabrata]|nr:malignant fibrous histiocytoma-amplified sequence 1 [Biomphalaria glabrata]